MTSSMDWNMQSAGCGDRTTATTRRSLLPQGDNEHNLGRLRSIKAAPKSGANLAPGARESLIGGAYLPVCTLAVYVRAFPEFPVIVAANRDEFFSRPTSPPLLLDSESGIFGGRDDVAGFA